MGSREDPITALPITLDWPRSPVWHARGAVWQGPECGRDPCVEGTWKVPKGHYHPACHCVPPPVGAHPAVDEGPSEKLSGSIQM